MKIIDERRYKVMGLDLFTCSSFVMYIEDDSWEQSHKHYGGWKSRVEIRGLKELEERV